MRTPRDLANELKDRAVGKIVRETWILPGAEARRRAKQLFEEFPSGAYLTEIENWRICRGGSVELTVKRLDAPIDEAVQTKNKPRLV
jgi:hypothetical protein